MHQCLRLSLVTFQALFGEGRRRVTVCVEINAVRTRSDEDSTPQCIITWPEGTRPGLMRVLQAELVDRVEIDDEVYVPHRYEARFEAHGGTHVVTFFPHGGTVREVEESVRALLAKARPKRLTHTDWLYQDLDGRDTEWSTLEDLCFTEVAEDDPPQIVITWPNAPVEEEAAIAGFMRELRDHGLYWDEDSVLFEWESNQVVLTLNEDGAGNVTEAFDLIARLYQANPPTMCVPDVWLVVPEHGAASHTARQLFSPPNCVKTSLSRHNQLDILYLVMCVLVGYPSSYIQTLTNFAAFSGRCLCA
jgi:hypothetical protein